MPTSARCLATSVLVAGGALAVLPAVTADAAVASHTSLTASQHTLHYNKVAHLATRVSGSLGALKNKPVAFWAARMHGSWHRVATVRTDDTGTARLAPRLRETTRWQVRFAGDLINDPSRSPVARIRVLPPPPPPRIAFGRRVVAEAARERGAPYQYGAAGPHAFDCSGLTMYVFHHFGIGLPHNAAAQYDDNNVRHVARANKQLGDLIFFDGSGGIYHVGIYAGHGLMWAAPHTGDHVRKESIYSSSYLVGRVH